MTVKAWIATAVAAVLCVGLMDDAGLTAGFSPWIKQELKPGDPPTPQGRGSGDDSCRWANDNECDDPDIGTGACRLGTDRTDCQYLRNGEQDACQWANDGECDEPGIGTGACINGSDRTDCGPVAQLRFRNDSCDTAFNNVCEEPGAGNGSCQARTDRRDCIGAERPMTINDHFFGRDDRIFVPVDQYPWTMVGQISMTAGGSCTATLIGADVLITAAHCIHGENGQTNAAGEFIANSGERARITHYFIDPNFDFRRFNTTNQIDGLDWALLRLDRPLGNEIGFLQVVDLTGMGPARALTANLYQAGFSWDTGTHLSGNLECHIIAVQGGENTFAHECDTTRGDSGSPFMVRSSGGRYSVVGTDSSFRSVPGQPVMNIAVSAEGWIRYLTPFQQRQIGVAIGQRQQGGSGPK
ncbi:trypsin-like serine peptidase [Brevundimonas aveniformis]|uniref:trypsin-like serine peptidase n=1 Tax=Brevundimonas aveniformis TaxID=370977 RepID=UPI000A062B4F|nr:trypsin-like serine protease [Brevundimonas aveniformis]